MTVLENRIKGALYGFAIGDAMGATTEFMTSTEIKAQYGTVKDIIGGGWLHLEPGEVTDDTQMTLCVCEAIDYAFMCRDEFENFEDTMLNRCCDNFVEWYLSNPPDIGGCCRRVISKAKDCHPTMCSNKHTEWRYIAKNPDSLGNGSLMRTMPIILSGQSEDLALLQGQLTHNNQTCDYAISLYYEYLDFLLRHSPLASNIIVQGHPPMKLCAPTGHVENTLFNAIYWTENTSCFEEAIIKAVNDGGDADTIAAITGSLVGAKYGFEAIPKRWIAQLSSDVKKQLDKYSKIFKKINKKVCTNVK